MRHGIYNTCSDIQGVLIARVGERPLPEFFAERLFEPLGMAETGFYVPAEKLERLAPCHGSDLAPIGDRLWREPPIFPSGSGGRVSTLADLHRFGRMLLGGRRRPPPAGVGAPDDDRPSGTGAAGCVDGVPRGSRLGFGGAVGADGRYGWIGGTGTTAHLVPSTGKIGILLTQVQMTGPTSTTLMRRFWQYAFAAS